MDNEGAAYKFLSVLCDRSADCTDQRMPANYRARMGPHLSVPTSFDAAPSRSAVLATYVPASCAWGMETIMTLKGGPGADLEHL